MDKKSQHILNHIKPLRQQLLNHNLYKYIETPDDLRIFTEHHVFAVWDFMSLLKTLQQRLTCVKVPWTPRFSSDYAYLINEIVLAEETDINIEGKRQSHFEMYIDAMEDIQASTFKIKNFITQIQHGTDVFLVISSSDLPESVKSFLIFTFNTIYQKHLHQVASAFTFGRENLIPDMFTEIIENILNSYPADDVSKLRYYFNRHIEIDEGEHGPMAIQLMNALCGNDTYKWKNAQDTAEIALKKRLKLYDGILKAIQIHKAIA